MVVKMLFFGKDFDKNKKKRCKKVPVHFVKNFLHLHSLISITFLYRIYTLKSYKKESFSKIFLLKSKYYLKKLR